MIILSVWSLSLLFLVTHFLNSAQPGGGCLFGITVTVSCCESLGLVSALGVSTSIRSSFQSDVKHQHSIVLFNTLFAKFPYKVRVSYLYLIIIHISKSYCFSKFWVSINFWGKHKAFTSLDVCFLFS